MRHTHAITVLALLALSAMPAVAQQRPPVNVVQAAASVPDAPSSPPPAIHRWVDARGQVHYSDKQKQPRKPPAEKVDRTHQLGTLQSRFPTPEEIWREADQQIATPTPVPIADGGGSPAAQAPAPDQAAAPYDTIEYTGPSGPRLRPEDYWPAGPIPPIHFTPNGGQ